MVWSRPWDVGVAVLRSIAPQQWRGEEEGQRLEQQQQLLEEWARGEGERERERELSIVFVKYLNSFDFYLVSPTTSC